MNYKVIIPARLDSTRLPNKPLKIIAGKTLLQRVVEQAKKSSAESVYVATDSTKIIEHCREIEVESVLTKSTHQTGSDRLSEACHLLGLGENEIILNVQGDEPFVDPKDIENLAKLMFEGEINMATLFTNLLVEEEKDANVVKLWMHSKNTVKDFSRDIDHLGKERAKKHLGIYGYKVHFLKKFVSWQQSKNELERNLEQMRVMDNNEIILATESQGKIHLGVDTPSDLALAIRIAENLS